MTTIQYLGAIDVTNQLGECILWDEQTETVWWTDILSSQLFSYHPDSKALQSFVLPDRLGSFGFTENAGQLVCAFAGGFAIYTPADDTIEWLAQPELQHPGNRFNDGRVDREGCFWAGTMVENPELNARGVSAALYRLQQGHCQQMLSGVSISNSLCWSPSGKTLYFADSPTHRIYSYPVSSELKSLPEASVFTDCAPFEPDGSTVDSTGHLWNALYGGGLVRCYNPQGECLHELALAVSQPTCVCLGGANLNTLFITTARQGLTEQQLEQQPLAGSVLMYKTSHTGIVECRYKTKRI